MQRQKSQKQKQNAGLPHGRPPSQEGRAAARPAQQAFCQHAAKRLLPFSAKPPKSVLGRSFSSLCRGAQPAERPGEPQRRFAQCFAAVLRSREPERQACHNGCPGPSGLVWRVGGGVRWKAAGGYWILFRHRHDYFRIRRRRRQVRLSGMAVLARDHNKITRHNTYSLQEARTFN
jgi:hypothetical protein